MASNGLRAARKPLRRATQSQRIRGVTGVDQYLMSETTTKANGKADCTGAVSKVGNTSNIYIFAEGNDAYVTCGSVDKTTCYGSARRVR